MTAALKDIRTPHMAEGVTHVPCGVGMSSSFMTKSHERLSRIPSLIIIENEGT